MAPAMAMEAAEEMIPIVVAATVLSLSHWFFIGDEFDLHHPFFLLFLLSVGVCDGRVCVCACGVCVCMGVCRHC